jgi:hypothetical protein
MKSASGPLTAVLVACAASALSAATLERLSFDDMVKKSAEIVRGRVTVSSTSFRGAPSRGGTIYTHYTVDVAERWKGGGSSRIDIAVPGGTVNGIRQSFPGAPALEPNADYVLFLWTSPSGLTQIIGFTQGVMNLKSDAAGKALLVRAATSEPMVDAFGRPVTDNGFSMSLTDFRNTMKQYGLAGVEK